MSWRKAAVIGGSVLVVGAAAAAGLYVADAWPTASGPVKAAAALPKGPGVPTWEAADVVLDAGILDDAAEAGRPDAAALEDLAGAAALGDNIGMSVVELQTGTVVAESNADAPLTPASTLKILTGAAVLDVLGPDHRFSTRVVIAQPPPGDDVEITLVGGGDPVLASDRRARVIPGAADLETLAEATAESLIDSGVSSVRLNFDDGLFPGPSIDPDWRSTYVPGGVVGPVNALAVDGARRTPGFRDRVGDPGQATADRFASLLADYGVDVAGSAARADEGVEGDDVAMVASPPLSAIVEHVMRTSDNDVAEALARHVAVGLGRPGTSNDASEAIADVVAGLGVDVTGVRVLDGSGLARGNAVTVSSLVSVVSLASGPERPDLRPLITGMPVSGFTGTLAGRAVDGGAGYVRAKTGTLTGVHSLAGLVVAADGTTYAFALLADDADDALGARSALDEFAAALVSY